ncbi:hypothetical protein TWF281_010466 [Arthrobotrys megalospora]
MLLNVKPLITILGIAHSFAKATPLPPDQTEPAGSTATISLKESNVINNTEPHTPQTGSGKPKETVVAIPIQDLGIDGSSSSTETHTSQTEPERPQAQNIGRAGEETVHPSFWYDKKGLRVRCHSPQFVFNLQPYSNPDFPHISPGDWYDWDEMARQHDVEYTYKWIHKRLTRCHLCSCDEQGKVIAGPRGNSDCRTQAAADFCAITLAELDQPDPTATSLTISDYQWALDNIPLTAKLANKGYRWLYGGNSIGFSPDSLDMNSHGPKEAAPGADGEALFFLEGPGPGDKLDKVSGLPPVLGPLLENKVSFLKRDSSGAKDTPLDPKPEAFGPAER